MNLFGQILRIVFALFLGLAIGSLIYFVGELVIASANHIQPKDVFTHWVLSLVGACFGFWVFWKITETPR